MHSRIPSDHMILNLRKVPLSTFMPAFALSFARLKGSLQRFLRLQKCLDAKDFIMWGHGLYWPYARRRLFGRVSEDIRTGHEYPRANRVVTSKLSWPQRANPAPPTPTRDMFKLNIKPGRSRDSWTLMLEIFASKQTLASWDFLHSGSPVLPGPLLGRHFGEARRDSNTDSVGMRASLGGRAQLPEVTGGVSPSSRAHNCHEKSSHLLFSLLRDNYHAPPPFR
ncbi:hypothetical protein HRG_012317 [Hirsutella rhossiliensis]